METGRGVEVMNPYGWLPSDGEDNVDLHFSGFDLSVIIDYDFHCENGKAKKKELLFSGVYDFQFSFSPGPTFSTFTSNAEDSFKYAGSGSLVEYPDSEAAAEWNKYFKDSDLRISGVKHFEIDFLSTGRSLTVFAMNFVLRDSI